MHGYLTTERVLLRDNRQIKLVPQAKNLTEPGIEAINLEAGEYEYVLKDIKSNLGENASVLQRLRLVTDKEISAWERFPPRLGRVSLGILEKNKEFDHQAEINPLREQLRTLRARHPVKQHYRFAVVNGFGGNLGDALIGATAFRSVAKLIERELGSFTVDFLHGWHTNQACQDLIDQDPYIGKFYHCGLTLAAFGQYDAHFDISGLISYANFDKMPIADWYLWWLGVEPGEIDATEKRNKLTCTYQSWLSVKDLLREAGEPRVYFAHEASVPLRSIPKPQARRIAQELLAADKNLRLVIGQSLDFQHPRLIDLSGKMNDVDIFKACLVHMQGLITIDSFPLHAADPLALPTVLLGVVFPQERFKYYPHTDTFLIPDAEKLPGWLKAKTSTTQEWEEMQPAYEASWKRVKGKDIYDRLLTGLQNRSKQIEHYPPHFNFAPRGEPRRFAKQEHSVHGHPSLQWKTRKPTPFLERVEETLHRHASRIVRSGSVVVHVGPADSTFASALAAKIYPTGQYHVIEPRRLYAQTQAANFLMSGFEFLHMHLVCPFYLEKNTIEINEIDPYSETDPLIPGNSPLQTPFPTKSLQDLGLTFCSLLLIQKPMPIAAIIKDGVIFLQEHKPFILMGPLSHAEAREACLYLKDLEYEIYSDEVGPDGTGIKNLAVIAIPPGTNIKVTGLMKINIE